MMIAVVISAQAFARTDPLPSWNATAAKTAIAAFDMDGTLTPEHPMPIALIPVLVDIKANVEKNPLLGARPAVAALLKGDLKTVAAQGEDGQADIIAAATDGKTTEEAAANVRPMLDKTISEKFGVPYTKTTYKPMRELVELLEANGFTVYICSGSPILYTREISEEMFGIPAEHVMGTWLETKMAERDYGPRLHR